MQDIIALGVTSFETFVFDNHTNYYGKDDFQIASEAFSETLVIANKSNIEQFKSDLKAHQQGKTDYMTFLNDCAKSGVEKWIVVYHNPKLSICNCLEYVFSTVSNKP